MEVADFLMLLRMLSRNLSIFHRESSHSNCYHMPLLVNKIEVSYSYLASKPQSK